MSTWLWTALGCSAVVAIVAYVIHVDREGRRAQEAHRQRMADIAQAITEEWIVKDHTK